MNDLRIEFEWEDPRGAKGPELRATWAQLSISVDGKPVTRVWDKRSRSVRDYVYGPLYPLAEWIAAHWWALYSEVEAPASGRNQSYRLRHDFAYARQGFVLPHMVLTPWGEETLISWHAADCPDVGVSFLENGDVLVQSDMVRNACAQFVSAVCARLDTEKVRDTFLQNEWEAIQNCDAEERAFCETAAALGLDPFALDDRDRRRLVTAHRAIPHGLAGEFFAAVDFDSIDDATNDLTSCIAQVRSATVRLPTLADLRAKFPPLDPAEPPWKRGYKFAGLLRSHLNVGDSVLHGCSGVAIALGVDIKALQEAILLPKRPDGFMDALVGANQQGRPVFVIGKHREDSRQFALCRSLYEYLTAPEPDSMALISKTRSDRQRANRAFAAEFLVPAAILQQRLRDTVVDDEQIDDLANEFGVSCFVIRHQIENQNLATIRST